MSLTVRKLWVIGMVLGIVLLGNILMVAHWLAEQGVIDLARNIRTQYLTGTALTIIDDYSYCTSSSNCPESSLKRVLDL